MIRGIEPQIARPLWSLDVFDDVVLLRSILMNDSERYFRIRGKRVSRGRIEPAPSTPVPIGIVATTLPAC